MLAPEGDATGPTAAAVQDAWRELRDHPDLVWVPPMWRGFSDNDSARGVMERRALSAVEHNLVIRLEQQPDGQLHVRIATGPLRDRPVDGGVDPLAPVRELDPKLEVAGRSFEEAIVMLRDAVRSHYGDAPDPAGGENVAVLALNRDATTAARTQ